MSKTARSVEVIKLIKQLEKCASSQFIYKLLLQIRSDVVKDEEGIKLLRDRGGLKHIVKFLNKPNEKILNITLSILANCCMQEECREQVVSYGVIPFIITIIKNINQDNIQSRACRLIGNLAQNHKICEKFHENHIVLVVVHVLNSSTSSSTQQMAIRALRLLWELSKYRTEMVKVEAVKAVAVHLASQDKDVKKAVLKALTTFTKTIKSKWLALQVQGGRPNLALLVAELGELHGNLCLFNLSSLETSRLQLIKDGLVELLVYKLRINIEHWLAMIFCQLCQDSTGRAHVRNCAGGLELLLKLLQSTKSKVIQSKALQALSFYIYDKTSLELLLMNGLVPTLIKSLADYVLTHGQKHSKSTASIEPLIGSLSPSSSGMSPQSHIGGQWSPISDDCSPTASPASVYSPICLSEDELEATPVISDDDINISLAEQMGEEDASEIKEEDVILTFLHHITNYVNIPIADLSTKLTVSTLIDYISLVKDANPRACRLLCAIAGNKNYYRQLLDDQFALLVHCRLCRPSHEHCVECERMLNQGTLVITEVSRLSQTGLGEGEMTYRLLKADDSVKLFISLTIPLVISHHQLLLKLLFKRQAIKFLMEALENKQNDAVASLYALFKTLKINNPQKAIEICSHCDVGSLRKESTVTFLLDDGSTVSANKSTLSNNSPVFEAMFRGGFKESDQTVVKLPEISAECVTYFSRIVDTYCECILPKNIKILLELIVASDRFLVPELTTKVLSVVMNHSLNYKTCSEVYNWALDVGFKYPIYSTLATDVIKFILTSNMTSQHRVDAISLMINSHHKKEFLEDLLDIIKSQFF